MKNLVFAVIICLLSVVLLKAQAVVETDKAALEQLNRRVVEASKEGKINDAADFARQTLELTIKIFGNHSEDTAIAYFNLGEIYRAKKDYKKAVENLEKALTIYLQDEGKFGAKIANTAQSLGISYGYDQNEYKAEQNLLMAVAAAEKSFGKENKAILPFLVNLRNFYIFSGNFDKADAQFARHYLTAAKIFPEDSEELEKIEDEHYCFAVRFYSDNMAKRRIDRFRDSIREARNSQDQPTFDLFAGEEGTAGDIINSKALKLVRPSYPSKAGFDRVGGKIPVKVTIDETGKVIEAKTFCGNPDLRKASEKAALKSKFTPTMADGKPRKVTGIIVYNFVLK